MGTSVDNMSIEYIHDKDRDTTDAIVSFDDAPAINIFCNIADTRVMYTVGISPPIAEGSFRTKTYNQTTETKKVAATEMKNLEAGEKKKSRYTIEFKDLDPNIEYKFGAST